MRKILAVFVVLGLVLAGDVQANSLILSEDFEDGVLDSRISIETVGTFNSDPGIKDITDFGSTKAFGYGMSTCSASCFDNYVTNFKITLTESTYISTISFKELELYDNWGSKGKIYIDGEPLSWGDYNENEDFGRQPTNDRQPDTTYREQSFSVNQYVTTIELTVHDITRLSEIFVDDVEIFGVVSTDGSISGFVTDASYTPIAGARVNLFQRATLLDFTFTDSAGHYEFISLANAVYRVMAITPGYSRDLKPGKVQQATPWGKDEFINLILSP